ncbi:MAG: hypothetical protein ACXQTZ_03305 [Candidatus Alkanophagales archaeon]
MNPLVLASVAFALFVVCPRMAGMVHVIAESARVSTIQASVVGTVLSLPLLVVMTMIFRHYGLIAALGFCVLTDLGAALVMRGVSLRAGLETLIIAAFVVLGVRVATLVSSYI